MKTIKNLISVFALMFLTLNLSAQSKVAHIDSQTLISEMPEVKEAQAQLEKLQKTYATEIDASMKEYQTKLQTYSADAQNQTQVTNDALDKRISWNGAKYSTISTNCFSRYSKKASRFIETTYRKS